MRPSYVIVSVKKDFHMLLFSNSYQFYSIHLNLSAGLELSLPLLWDKLLYTNKQLLCSCFWEKFFSLES